MSGHPDLDALELLALGQGTPEDAAHAAGCAECAREVAWAKAEHALFARRQQPDVSALWSGVEQRLAEAEAAKVKDDQQIANSPPRRPHWHRPPGLLARAAVIAAVAAAVVIFVMRPKPLPIAATTTPQQTAQVQPPPTAQPAAPRSRLDPKTLAALDTAEADYRHAAGVLEAEYETLRPRLDPALAKRWDETLTRARTQLGESRAVAADDVRARMRVLDGYAEYLRSLRDVIQDSEEASP